MDSARYATLWRFLLVFQSGAVTIVALLLLVLLGIMEYYSNHDAYVLIWLLAYSPLILLLTIAWPIWQLSLFSRGRYGHPAILLWLLLQLLFVPLGTLAAIVQMVCLFHLTSKEST